MVVAVILAKSDGSRSRRRGLRGGHILDTF